ncbi:hypothetical protein ACFOZ7_05130 [Natribaculum luteum]|uniref:DUF6199 domain-containing protein n=1 Tax=Natribaculum luteum TaxID=1586232 RepID=A0ABD5NW87_9EURY|nr:hypothetical protein [Natribaculum luteum]
MVTSGLRKLWYGWMIVQGLAAAASPRRSLALNLRIWGCGFENVADLEPRPWYVRLVRAAGVGLVAAGIAGVLLEDRAQAEQMAESELEAGAETETETAA